MSCSIRERKDIKVSKSVIDSLCNLLDLEVGGKPVLTGEAVSGVVHNFEFKPTCDCEFCLSMTEEYMPMDTILQAAFVYCSRRLGSRESNLNEFEERQKLNS